MMSTLSLAVPTYPAGPGDEPALLRAQAQLCGSSHDKHLDAAVLLPTELSVVAGNRKDLPESIHLTIASRPLFVSEMGESIEVILATAKAEYFSNQGWTRDLREHCLICPAGWLPCRRSY
jgi:hypothetical protein